MAGNALLDAFAWAVDGTVGQALRGTVTRMASKRTSVLARQLATETA